MAAEARSETAPVAPPQRVAEGALASALTLVAILWALDVPQRLQLQLFDEQLLAFVLALALPLTFLATSPGRRRYGRAAWYDLVAAAAGAAAAGYIAWRYPDLQNRLVDKPLDGVIISIVLVGLVLEGVRRTCGLALVLIVLCFIAYALVGHLIPGQLGSRPVMWDRLAVYLAMDLNALIGRPLLIAVEVVVAFIFMGQILARGGGATYFTDLALALTGRSRGGPGKIAVVSSMLFGTISGSAVANVASTGVITIPMMKRAGFPAHSAGAIEAVASTGGQLVPPVMGAAAFLMAELLRLPYRDIVLAAIAPSLIYYLALFVWVDFYAGRHGIRFVELGDAPTARAVLRSGWHFPLPFAALFYALFWLNWSPQLSAFAAAGVLALLCMAFGYRGRRMNLRDVLGSLASTGTSVLEVVLICAAAGLVIGVLNFTGLAFGLTQYLASLAASSLIVLLITSAAVGVVLGMGMPTVAVYVLLATLIGPALIAGGIDPLAAHFFLFYFGMLSMVTPPVALASFTAASIAKADLWRTGWEGVKIGWVAYLLPFAFVFQPALLFRGDLAYGLWEFATDVLAVVAGTAALAGYIRSPLARPARLALGAAALLLLAPAEAVAGGWILNAAGAVIGLATIVLDWRRARAAPA